MDKIKLRKILNKAARVITKGPAQNDPPSPHSGTCCVRYTCDGDYDNLMHTCQSSPYINHTTCSLSKMQEIIDPAPDPTCFVQRVHFIPNTTCFGLNKTCEEIMDDLPTRPSKLDNKG